MEQEFREVHCKWLESRKEEEEEEERNATAAEVPVGELDTSPTAFAPRNLPTTHISADADSSVPQAAKPPPTVFSAASSVSSPSDLTPSELGEDTTKGSDDPTSTVPRHEKFYLEDGDIEIICRDTIFRVHSPIISFSSSRIRDILSKSALDRPMPQGHSRVIFEDSAEDFAVLLKMIYTPG